MKKLIAYFLGVQSPVGFFLTLWGAGTLVGEDQFGNRYYRAKARKNKNHERRWVVYKSGHVEASEVPPEFHGWLHHQQDVFPQKTSMSMRRPWQKDYTPNLTGSNIAYSPREFARVPVTGDYEAWTPND